MRLRKRLSRRGKEAQRKRQGDALCVLLSLCAFACRPVCRRQTPLRRRSAAPLRETRRAANKTYPPAGGRRNEGCMHAPAPGSKKAKRHNHRVVSFPYRKPPAPHACASLLPAPTCWRGAGGDVLFANCPQAASMSFPRLRRSLAFTLCCAR